MVWPGLRGRSSGLRHPRPAALERPSVCKGWVAVVHGAVKKLPWPPGWEQDRPYVLGRLVGACVCFLEPNSYAFVPFSVESYGCLGKPVVKLLHDLGDKAAGPGGVTWASFLEGALRELSIGLVRENYFMHRSCVGAHARLTEQSFRTGMTVPTDEPLV
jgi:hypothetical protein